MNTTISKDQIRGIEARLKVKKEDDNRKLTENDRILEMFTPIKAGIRQNGLTIIQIAKGIDKNKSYKEICYTRVQVCYLAKRLVQDGIPFGGLKVGKEKKYGFPSAIETKEIIDDRKLRMFSEFKAGEKYLEDSDPLKKLGRKFADECDKQLDLYSGNFN